MRHQSFLIFLLLLLGINTYSQQAKFEQANLLSSNEDVRCNDITTDQLGNAFVIGSFKDTIDFDLGVGVTQYVSSINTGFIAKYDSLNNLIWVRIIQGTDKVSIANIALDNNSNIILTGIFKGTVDLNPGSGSFYNTSGTTSNYDTFILKLNSLGNFQWSKVQECNFNASWINVSGLAIDGQNNIFTTGTFYVGVDLNPSGSGGYHQPVGLSDIYVLKLSANGLYIWSKTVGSSKSESSYDLNIDINDNLIVTGTFFQSLDCDPGPNSMTVVTNGYDDMFVFKWNNAGNCLWAKSIGGAYGDYGRSACIDVDGNVFTTGYFSDTVDFDPGIGVHKVGTTGINDIDYFIQKLDSNGNFKWVNTSADPNINSGSFISNDQNGGIYHIGLFSDTVDFDPGPNVYNLMTQTSCFFIQKLDSSGNFIWVKSFSGGYHTQPTSLHVTASMDLYITGYLKDSINFDIRNSTNTLYSKGQEDGYFVKMTPCTPDYTTDTLIVCDSFYWAVTGTTFYNSGSYQGVTYNSTGCDSTINLYLTVINSTTATQVVQSCDSFIWVANGQTYYQGGIYFDTITNLAGCDSIRILNLNISNTVFKSFSVNSCDSFVWVQKGQTYYASGIYYDTLISSDNCDSIVSITLTINSTSYSNTTNVECDSFYWDADSITYYISGNYTSVLSNTNGCDSIIQLALTIISINDSVAQNSVSLFSMENGANYQWLDCSNNNYPINNAINQSFTPDSNGLYAVEISKATCIDTSNCYLISGIGFDNIESDYYAVVVYPNPTFGKVFIQSHLPQRDIHIRVRNLLGEIIMESNIKSKDEINFYIHQPKGVYFVDLLFRNGDIRTFKLIKI